jgi:outer membrane protein OmpA-like peptidoglycan-associated protein
VRRNYQWKPSKWLVWAPVMAGLPALAAGWITSAPLWQDLEQRTNAALAQNSGLKVTMDGRDAVITGDAASKTRLEDAIRAVSSTYGVRRVDTTRAAIAPAARLSAPTAKLLVSTDATPVITGTWPEDPANTLSVSVGEKTYVLGKDKALTSADGKWSLAVPTNLPDAKYDVTVSVSDDSNTTSSVKAAGGLTVDTTAPEAPKLAPSPANVTWPFDITGTWPEADSKSFAIEFQNKKYELGIAPELKSDGKGKFTFNPEISLPTGTYDLSATLTDKLGNQITHQFPKAVVIADPSSAVLPDVNIKRDVLMPTPTVKNVQTYATRPVLRGTWPANAATNFRIEVAGETYELGKTPSLVDDAFGNWMLKLDKPLPAGSYDVEAIATDALKVSVRDVTKGELVIKPAPPKPPSMNQPTVEQVETSEPMPTLNGTWDNSVGKALSIDVAGSSYELGKSKALSSNSSGQWTLKLSKPLRPGTYDVDAISTDSIKISIRDVTNAELVIRLALLQAPTVDTLQSDQPVTVVTGTWPVKDAESLRVVFAGSTYELGRSPNLTTDATGKWSLKLSQPLSDGSYDIEAIATGEGGLVAKDKSSNEVVIAVPPPPPPPPPKPAPVVIKLEAPTVTTLETSDATPVITGTWPEGKATSLIVTVGNQAFELGKAPALKTANGKWSLALPAALSDAPYEVRVSIADGQGNSEQADAPRGLIIDTAPPAAPVLKPVAANAAWPFAITGVWPEADAKSLSVDFGGRTYVLGADSELQSDGKGNFTFAPKSELKPGSYDMKVIMSDKLGNTSEFPIAKAVMIASVASAAEPVKAPEPKPAPVPKPVVIKPAPKKPVETVIQTTGYDCATDLERIANSFPVRFEFRKSEITNLHEFTISQVAALLRDPRCAGLRIEIEGHTDFRGTYRYNQLLSELRAERVLGRLVQDGVSGGRLLASGQSEARPKDPARTDSARAKNRRVEFRIIK